MDKDSLRLHEDEVMAAFERLKQNMSETNEAEKRRETEVPTRILETKTERFSFEEAVRESYVDTASKRVDATPNKDFVQATGLEATPIVFDDEPIGKSIETPITKYVESSVVKPDEKSATTVVAESAAKKEPKISDHTQVVATSKKAGVIDRAEWDRMLEELDKKTAEAQAKEEARAKEVKGDTSSAPSRASRHAAKADTSSKKLFGGFKAKEKVKEEEKSEEKATPVYASLKEKHEQKQKEAKAKLEIEKENAEVKKKKPKKKMGVFKKILLAILAVCVVVCCVVGAKVIKIIKDAPAINPNNIYNLLSQSSTIVDKNGEIIDNIYAGDALRTNVDYADIPQQLIDAFVSIEDKTFFKHNGFNYVRIIGAVWEKISGKSDRIGGTSTITQQLARNIFLTSEKGERSMTRKIREAYYTMIIEHTLSKEQILEAYLNTVYLGFNSNGVAAASRAYFNKDIKDLNLMECAQLAALPQSPNNYAPLKRVEKISVSDVSTLDVVASDETYITYYNNSSEDRLKLVLRFMHEQNKIDDATYETAKADTIRNYLNPGVNIGSAANNSSYCTDYVTSQVMKDLQNKLGYTYQEAYDLLYKGGLVVNSTLDLQIQTILEKNYSNPDLFPKISLNSLNLDKDKNIVNVDGDKVILYASKNMLDSDGNFILKKDEIKWNEDGSLTVYKGYRVNLYNTKSNGESDVRVDIKDFYETIDGQLYSRSGSYWNIASKYKTRDNAGNLIISAAFFTDQPDAFVKNKNGSATLSSKFFVLGSRIIQPQSAMCIVDNETGQLRAMVGGRGISGKLLFNRATTTRQPGSSMKPLAVYSTALQLGYDATKEGSENANGKIFTAATTLDNIPMANDGQLWPSNFDGTYTGRTSLRKAVERSLNGCAVNLYCQLDPKACIENVQNLGITSLVLEGDATDENPSSLALGGMIKGVSPLEMANAYATFANYGEHNDSTCYTTVTDRKGTVILQAESHPVQVLDEEVASLMLNILETTVTHGIASGAKLKSQPSAGKTGTTSEQYDIWFCGLTPKYAASTWVGCDSNINLGSDSSKATKIWKAIMEEVGKLDEKGSFQLKGNFVTVTVDKQTGQLPLNTEYAQTPDEDKISEIFIKGTEPTIATQDDDARGYVEVCAETGYLATPNCPHTYKEYIVRPGGESWEKVLADAVLYDKEHNSEGKLLTKEEQEKPGVEFMEVDKTQYLNIIPDADMDYPDFYCPIHNPDVETYPTSPIQYTYSIPPWLYGDPDAEEGTEDGEVADGGTEDGNTADGNTTQAQ